MAELTKRTGGAAYRAGAAMAVAASFLVSWVNMAVGIAGSEENPVNLSFFVLVLIAAVGAFAAEFRAKGMARTMFCVAAVQMMLGAIVSTGPVAAEEPAGPLGLFALNALFAVLWAIAGTMLAWSARIDSK